MFAKETYVRPSAELLGVVSPRQLLASSSLGGDFVNFEDSGTVEDWTTEEV